MIEITSDHNLSRLGGTMAFTDTGTGVAKLAIYGTDRQTIADIPIAPPLVEIPLQNPSGEIGPTGLTLLQAEDGLIMETGIAKWARLFTRSGAVSTDFDVRADADPVGNGEIAFPSTQLYAGGLVRLTNALLT